MDAEQKLRNLSFDDADLGRDRQDQDTTNLLEIVAPIDGTIVASPRRRGEAVEPTTQLFTVADTARCGSGSTSTRRDIAAVAPGQPVTFTISGTDPRAKARVFPGKVTWVGTEVNPTTRTTAVRAELANPDGRLRANQFGQAEHPGRPEHEAARRARGGRAGYEDRGPGVPPAEPTASTARSGSHPAADRTGRGRGRPGPEAGPAGRHDRGLPPQVRAHEGRHRGRLLRLTAARRGALPMLNALIGFSLRNRFVVLLAGGLLVVARGRARRSGCRSTPSRTRPRSRSRSTPSPRRSRPRRSSGRSPSRSSYALGGLEGPARGPLGLEVRPLPGRRHLRGRHRHLLRPPADQRAARRGRSCPRGSPGRRWGRSPPAWARSITTC